MAIVQYTAIVNQIRGKLNGSQFNKARNASTLQRKAQQSSASKGMQDEPRSFFQQFQRRWKELSPAEHAAWQQVANNNPDRDRFGNLVVLAGYNKFIQAQMRSIYSGDLVPIVDPDVNPAPAWLGAGFSQIATFSISPAGSVLLSGSVTPDGGQRTDDFGWSLDVSLPVSPGVTVYYGRYSWVVGGTMSANFPSGFSQELGDRYPLPRAGDVVIFRFRVVYNGNGVQVAEFFNRIIIS